MHHFFAKLTGQVLTGSFLLLLYVLMGHQVKAIYIYIYTPYTVYTIAHIARNLCCLLLMPSREEKKKVFFFLSSFAFQVFPEPMPPLVPLHKGFDGR
jgi:hypothetical protein